jgi:putative Mg2+ transporter-C (MgtC) family protein
MNPIHWLTTESLGQTVIQLGELTLALVLSSLIGLEREIRMESSGGLRTHALVGVAAALIMVISKYGFGNVILADRIVLDPSRIAAQTVTGIGFIGGGLIFVQRDVVRGITTAAGIWLTGALGMSCGAGLPLLALYVTGAYFLVVFGFGAIARTLSVKAECNLLIEYGAGQGAVHQIMKLCSGALISVHDVPDEGLTEVVGPRFPSIHVRLRARGSFDSLIMIISDLPHVKSVRRLMIPK